MRIDDDELRELFKTTGEERVQAIDNGLLHLEQHPDDLATISLLLREMHSLKGDSNMLGQSDLGSLAHQMEHILTRVSQGEQPFTAELGDRLAKGMIAVRQLIQAAITGEPSGVQPFYVLAELMGSATGSEESPDLVAVAPHTARETGEHVAPSETGAPDSVSLVELSPEPQPTPEAQPLPVRASAAATMTDAVSSSSPELDAASAVPEATYRGQPSGYRIETVRVPTPTLDHLMTQAGELTVTKIRVAHRMGEVEAITNLWEDWNRDIFVNRFLADERHNQAQDIQQLQSFFNRAETHVEQLGTLATRLRGSLYEDITRLETLSDELEAGIRTLRLLPLSTIFNLFPRLVRDLARQEGKEVELIVEGGETKADKRIIEEMKDPLMHMLRNAIDHGIETPAERVRQGKPPKATLTLRGYQVGNTIGLEVIDDGRGLDVEAIKEAAMRKGLHTVEELEAMSHEQLHGLILSPGFSTRTMVTEVSGRGVGLDVLRTNVERLKGQIEVISQPGQGCTLRVRLGTTLSTAHVLIVLVQGVAYALPVEWVDMARLVSPADIFMVKGQPTILHNDQPVSVAALTDLLGLDETTSAPITDHAAQRACILLKVGSERLGVFVDALIDEQDVVLKPQSQLLKRVPNISGATILGTGEVCMVLNPQDLLQSVRRGTARVGSQGGATAAAPVARQRSVLLVEDSIATRTQEKRILEAGGYHVVTAVDGMDGFNKLQTQAFDAVVSDVQMPNLDGLGLTQRIRQHKEYNEIPVILVTTLASDADRQRGAEAGANAYITKGSFNQGILLDTLERLI